MKGALLAIALPLVALPLIGCFPNFDDAPYLVQGERVLAIRGIPAEARPNTPVRYEALVASERPGASIALAYSYCTDARRAEERTGVSEACLRGDALTGIEETSTMPSDACARFGPNTPPSLAGEAPHRPSDPDPSGGYFLPIRALTDGEAQAFGFHRIHCDLAGATRDIFDAYQRRYRDNRHPQIDGVELGDSLLGEPDGDPLIVSQGERLPLRVLLRADAFEDFVVYSANDSALFDRQEELRVHWYVSGGSLDTAEQVVDRLTRSAQNNWTAPPLASEVHIYVVVQDSRGGASWLAHTVRVE